MARELCQRAGSKAYIAGAIASLGSEYVLGLKAVNCRSGDTLAQEQVTAASKEKVLDALGEAASKLRGELGESLATVQRFEFRWTGHHILARSAEGVQPWQKGCNEKGPAAALPYDQRAIELDPNFAMGYSAWAMTTSALGEMGRASEYSPRHSSCGNMPASGKSWRSPPTTTECNRRTGQGGADVSGGDRELPARLAAYGNWAWCTPTGAV